jgi:hypothetical protein
LSEVLDLQVYSLLARLHEEQDSACRRLREAAKEQSAQLVAEGRSRARRRVKEAVLEKRRRVEEHCRQVRVKLETRHREERFAELGKRLADGLAMLPGALETRWADEASRISWCQMVLEGAAASLRRGGWRLEVACGLTAVERDQFAARAAELAGSAVEVAEIDSLRAGLVVLHDGVRFDGSVAGLLSDSMRVQAALLAELSAGERSP